MILDLDRILGSKSAQRQRMASRPIAEKLRMLDALRERTVAIRGRPAAATSRPRVVREGTNPSRSKPG
jgi:hypothetical protein